jgi:hypothetical protein
MNFDRRGLNQISLNAVERFDLLVELGPCQKISCAAPSGLVLYSAKCRVGALTKASWQIRVSHFSARAARSWACSIAA